MKFFCIVLLVVCVFAGFNCLDTGNTFGTIACGVGTLVSLAGLVAR